MTVSHRAPDVLRAHPLNERVYDADRDGEELRASIAEHGILTPLVIDQHGTILSGHRRWQAARDLGLGRIPVVVRHVDEPLEAEHVLLESNRQREKTYSERMREAEHIKRIVAEEAKRRMLAGRATDPPPTLGEGRHSQETVAQVAEVVGMKRSTFAKVERVHTLATDETQPEPVRATAQQAMAALDAGETTPHAADRVVREAEARVQAGAEQAESDRLLAHVTRGGAQEDRRLRVQFFNAKAAAQRHLLSLDPTTVRATLQGGDLESARDFLAQLAAWSRAFEDAGPRGLRVVRDR